MVSKYYEYATWVLGVLLVVCAGLLVRSKSIDPDTTMAIKVGQSLRGCSVDIATWQGKYPVGTKATDESQIALIQVFSDCISKFE